MPIPKLKQYPRSLIINEQEWSLKFIRKRPKDWDDTQIGECDPSDMRLTILYSNKQTSMDILATVLHEVIHAIEFSYGIRKLRHRHVYKVSEALAEILASL